MRQQVSATLHCDVHTTGRSEEEDRSKFHDPYGVQRENPAFGGKILDKKSLETTGDQIALAGIVVHITINAEMSQEKKNLCHTDFVL